MVEIKSTGAIATAGWADPDYICDKYFFRPGDIWIGRNPHDFDEAVGYRDNRHVLVCAGSGSGKGRSFIINNLALWPGSTVTYDPKGELPVMLAARRGQGASQPGWECEGMGQDVFVLDPLNHSGVEPEYLAYFDPLSGLDPDDGELPTWCKRIANALVEIPDSGDAAEWARRAVRLIALIIQHVLTYEHIPDEDRNLMYVLRLLLEGNAASAERLSRAEADRVARINEKRGEGEPPEKPRVFDPFDLLLREMTMNKTGRGWIASEARSLMRQVQQTPKFIESVRGEATDRLDWFKSAGIERSLTGWGDQSRRFEPERLKTDPHGISVFIVMPVDDLKTYAPWVQAVFLGIFAAMRKVRGAPASGHQTLMILDEFSSLGYQEYIVTAMDNIRGAGCKLAIIVQNFGALKKRYGDEMESFFSNSSLELYFGKIGETAQQYLEKQLGQTEVVRTARSENRSESTSRSTSKTVSTSTSESVAFGETMSEGGSETFTLSDSTARSHGRAWNWSKGVNWGNSSNYGSSSGSNMGRNYGPHIFFEGFEHSSNYGSTLSKNRGKGHTRGGSKTHGGSRSENTTRSQGRSRATGSSWNRGTSRTETETRGQSSGRTTGKTKGYQIGGGTAETFHKKPLLEPHEAEAYLRPFEDDEHDHPAYPGLVLVRVQGESPFFLRRSNYDQDPYFEECFTPDPAHEFVPPSKQRLLGYQYTEQHIVTFSTPPKLLEYGYEAHALPRRFEWFEANRELFAVEQKRRQVLTVPSPSAGRVMATTSQDQDDDSFLTVRCEHILDKAAFERVAYGQVLRLIHDQEERARREALEAERRQREREEAERRREALEAERLRREQEEADRLRREREGAERQRREQEQAALAKARKERLVTVGIGASAIAGVAFLIATLHVPDKPAQQQAATAPSAKSSTIRSWARGTLDEKRHLKHKGLPSSRIYLENFRFPIILSNIATRGEGLSSREDHHLDVLSVLPANAIVECNIDWGPFGSPGIFGRCSSEGNDVGDLLLEQYPDYFYRINLSHPRS